MSSRQSDIDPDAIDMAARCLGANDLAGWTQELLHAAVPRTALLAVAAGGWPATIDTALALMAQKATARLAGFAFSQITGADLVKLNLELDSGDKNKNAAGDEVDDEAPSADEEANHDLPEPDPQRVAAWWNEHRGDFNTAVRYLAGRPIREPSLALTLADGTQPQRRAAAIERARLLRGTPVYNTSQPGFLQARDWLGWP
jgi:uncharacterized protein (TIGR02270 family)